jgi:hypothetical protein
LRVTQSASVVITGQGGTKFTASFLVVDWRWDDAHVRVPLPLLFASIEEKRQRRRLPSSRDAAAGCVAATVIIVFYSFPLPFISREASKEGQMVCPACRPLDCHRGTLTKGVSTLTVTTYGFGGKTLTHFHFFLGKTVQ